jgi:hypothetical protein
MTTLREAVQEFVADYDCGGCGHFAAYAERFRAALRAANPPVWEQYVVFEDNNGALRRRPEDCQAFGADGQPAAVYVGPQRYVPEPVQTPCDIAEDGVCEVIDCCRNSAQQEQEPVAWQERAPFGYIWPTGRHPEFRYTKQMRDGVAGMPLYTTPPRREWQGLTEEEIEDMAVNGLRRRQFARDIEAALKEKNHD